MTSLLSPTSPLGRLQKTVCLITILAPAVAAVAADAPTSQSASSATTAPAQSAGLGNDWLRKQSGEWEKWDIGGQFRMRYEIKQNAGYISNNDFVHNRANDNDYLMERLKYHLGYTPAPWFTAYVEGRSSFEEWDRRAPSPELDRFNLRQAFLLFGNPKALPVTVKVGRQELLYGEERMVGIGDWSTTGRTFDAAKIRLETESCWVDAFAGRVVVPTDGRFNVANDYDWLMGLYGSTTNLIPWQETQLYFLSHNASSDAPNAIAPGVPGTPTSARDIYTYGTRWASLPGKLGGWDYSLEAAGQFGSINQAKVRRVQQAYSVFASGGYTWKDAWASPRLGLGYEHGSGDHNPNDGKNQTFDNLFGTNHRFYGVMDLFSQRNLHIPRLGASLKPLKNLTLSSEYLLFWMVDTHDSLYPEASSGRSVNGYGKHPDFHTFVGSELDIVASYAATSFCDVQLGYGHFFVGDYIRQSVNSVAANGGAVDANWTYFQLRLNF
ncbi:MAG: alginate export family protein [Verrucomicrobiota bacterium]